MRPDLGHLLPTEDGYTFDLYLRAVEGCYPEFRATYRPVTSVERDSLYMGIRGMGLSEVKDRYAEILADRIKTWSIQYPEDATGPDGQSIAGQPVPITVAAVRPGLKPPLFDALREVIITWERASDIDPLWKSTQSAELMKAREEAARTGKPVGVALLEMCEKNSGKASR